MKHPKAKLSFNTADELAIEDAVVSVLEGWFAEEYDGIVELSVDDLLYEMERCGFAIVRKSEVA